MFAHVYAEDLLAGTEIENIARWIEISVEVLTKLPKSQGKSVGEWDLSILKAKCGYGKAFIMAKRKPANGTNSAPSTGSNAPLSTRWVNANLSDEDLAEIEGTELALDVIGAGLLALAGQGWDINLKLDGESGGYSCMGFTKDPHTQNGRVGLSGWSGDPASASLVFLYKYHELLGGVIPEPVQRSERRFR